MYEFEKIIGRKEHNFNTTKWERKLKHKIVLIAGVGSIGSNLAKILASFNVKYLYLIDFSEIALCKITDELNSTGFRNFETILLDLKTHNCFKECIDFDYVKFDYIINTAAYKHVIFCERNKTACFRNNIDTTHNILTLKTRKHILISTDKAVYPTNTMGESKRICELMYLSNDKNTQIIRFGNVYGSSGSLLPRIIQGIHNSRVMITDRLATRYFISISESSGFIIETMLNSKKKINIFDMAKPVNISKIIENLKGFINILRVYTNETDREKVERATTKILGRIPATAKISY